MTPDPITAVLRPARRPPRAAHPARRPRSRALSDRAARPRRLSRAWTSPRPATSATGCPRRLPARARRPRWWKLAAADRQEPIARLRAWVEQVYRPGYGHLAATLGPCWACPRPVPVRPGHPVRACGPSSTCSPAAPPALLSAQAEYQARILPALADQLRPRPPAAATPAPPPASPEHAMTDATLRQALAYARRGWPVFPCLPGQKIPATPHGYRDATTDRAADHRLVRPPPRLEPGHRHRRPRPRRPGRRPARPSRQRLPPPSPGSATPGCWTAPAAYVRTPSGGLHAYFTGSDQRNGHLPAHHLDFRSARRLRPGPALPDRRPAPTSSSGHPAATAAWTGPPSPGSCNPSGSPAARSRARPRTRTSSHLARWVASQPEGNRNAGLFWAANRALDADPAADLSPLAAAARQAGLDDQEITRTLDSARRTGQARPNPPDHQAEAVS